MLNGNQKGFTLIELMIVVMILAVFAGFVMAAASRMTPTDLRTAASKFDALISQSKVMTMSGAGAGNVELVLAEESDGFYGIINVDGVEDTKELIVDSGILVYTKDKEDDSSAQKDIGISEDSHLIIRFNKETGAFISPEAAHDLICFEEDDVRYTIKLTIATGHHEISR